MGRQVGEVTSVPMGEESLFSFWWCGITAEVRHRLYFIGIPFIGGCRWYRDDGRRWIGRSGVFH